MKKTGGSVGAFIADVTPAKRRRDAETMVALMSEVTGREPELWGTIIGFGSCHYAYPTGTEGDSPIAAFASMVSFTRAAFGFGLSPAATSSAATPGAPSSTTRFASARLSPVSVISTV